MDEAGYEEEEEGGGKGFANEEQNIYFVDFGAILSKWKDGVCISIALRTK